MEFILGSCVSGNIIDGVFIKGTCVNEEKNEDTIFQMPHLPLYNLDVTRGWITQQKYRSEKNNRNPYFKGPTHESNWLLHKNTRHGGLVVGGYPDTTFNLLALFSEELQTFVCLNSEYGKTVNSDYFQPYGTNLPKNQFIHEPIDDMQTVNDETIIALAQKIVERLLNGENVYLHCAGGHGRTGTVAIVTLHMLYPELTELELFEFVQYAHDQRGGNYFGERMFNYKMIVDPLSHYYVKSQVPSPQTFEQRTQVRRIIKK
jgi:protein-tyrosine phosphatase